MYNDQFNRMEALFKELSAKIDKLEKKVDDLIEDEDEYEEEKFGTARPQRNEIVELDRFIEEDEIYKRGQRIPYSRLTSNKDLDAFRDFIGYIIMHPDKFTDQEVDYAGFSDKNFKDIRLADKTRRILSQAYMRMHKKMWDFNFERGHMHKFQGQIAWSWANGDKD